MLKVGIVGCGKIADAHAAQIQRISACEIVGVCDREPLMARQLADRFRIKRCYTDLQTLLAEAQPDVVHIATPPEKHFNLAKICLEAGSHVYVEKPFAINEPEVQALINLANERGLKLTAGHDDQFSHVAQRLRATVQSGFLGDKIVHMESYYGYEFSESGYPGALLSDKNHWVRKLPGKLLHNIISHGIARIAEYLIDDHPQVVAQGFPSQFLQDRGESEFIDELRVLITDKSGVTAYFVFSSQMRPSLHLFRIYGNRNGAILDQDQETLIKLRGARYKSYAEKFVPPVTFAKQYLANLRANLGQFWAREFQMKAGMKDLIDSFYRSIEDGAPLPIPYREILLTARIMDSIFSQLATEQSSQRKQMSLQSIP